MADTDLPAGFGEAKPAPRRPRLIASPFGVMPTPGINVAPDHVGVNLIVQRRDGSASQSN